MFNPDLPCADLSTFNAKKMFPPTKILKRLNPLVEIHSQTLHERITRPLRIGGRGKIYTSKPTRKQSARENQRIAICLYAYGYSNGDYKPQFPGSDRMIFNPWWK
jgi:hypothetical protein